MKCKIHVLALETEASKPSTERLDVLIPKGTPVQKRVDDLSGKSFRSGYMRLMKTAYNLALHPTMSLNSFGMLISTQRMNGVKFISGKVPRN